MQNRTRFLPGFHWETLRRKPRSAAVRLADEQARIREHSLIRLQDCFSRYIPASLLDQAKEGDFSRRRVFSKFNTFWAFLAQVLSADKGCREVVRKLQALATARGMPMLSSSTSAYCQARAKLDLPMLSAVLSETCAQVRRRARRQSATQRRVVVVDGTGLSMPDTPENQAQWPQQSGQKPGCGFPQMRLCACFDLQTGGLLSYRIGNRKQHELLLFRQQWDQLESGDIVLGDKGFSSFFDVWHLLCRGMDTVHALARRTPQTAKQALKVLGPDDLLIQWPKPQWSKGSSYSLSQRNALPESLTLRQIRVQVNNPGFRTQVYYLITTLLDSDAFSRSELADLYYQRWRAELNFRDIKTTLGMDVLRSLKPERVEREVVMYLIAYNVLRLMIDDAARAHEKSPTAISFKASLQAVRNWEPHFNSVDITSAEIKRLVVELAAAVANAILHPRPGRTEPRCLKRRPKPYGLLTEHRRTMRETPHRSRYRAKSA